MIHLDSKQREPSSERTPHSAVRCHRTRGDRPVSGDKIRECRGENEVDANSKWNGTEHRHDPVDAIERRECNPEETNGYEDSARHPNYKAHLRRRMAIVPDGFALVNPMFPLKLVSRGRSNDEYQPIPIRL